MKNHFSISLQSFFFHIIIVGFLFPRGYSEINTKYHMVCSGLMWLSVLLTWAYWLKNSELKKYILRGKIKKTVLQISSYFICAIIITAICRKNFSSGLQQLFAAPTVCVFMILGLKKSPQRILNAIINILCIEFTINILLSIRQPYINGIYHTIFLGHIQVVSQYGILAILVGTLFWLLYRKGKRRIIYLFIVTIYTMITTDAESALFTVIGLISALIIYKWKLSQLLMFKSEIYIFVLIILSGLIVYLSCINANIISNIDINGRGFIWQDALKRIAIHPIIGYGVDGVLLETFWSKGFNYAHNQLVQNFLDGGLVLAISFWTMIIGFSNRINKIEITKYKVLCNASLIALLCVMLVDSTTLYIYMYMILSIIFSVKSLIN